MCEPTVDWSRFSKPRAATMPSDRETEPEYIVVQPGLDGAAWLGEIIDGEPSPIGKISEILAAERALRERVEALDALCSEAITQVASAPHSHWRVGGSGGRCGACEAATERANELNARRAALAAGSSPSEEAREGGRLRCTYCGEWGHLNAPCPFAPSEGDAEERGVHRNDYYDGDGFVYCQECYEALDDYVLISDCPARPAPTEEREG